MRPGSNYMRLPHLPYVGVFVDIANLLFHGPDMAGCESVVVKSTVCLIPIKLTVCRVVVGKECPCFKVVPCFYRR